MYKGKNTTDAGFYYAPYVPLDLFNRHRELKKVFIKFLIRTQGGYWRIFSTVYREESFPFDKDTNRSYKYFTKEEMLIEALKDENIIFIE